MLESLEPIPLNATLALVFHEAQSRLSLVTAHEVRKTRRGPALDVGHPLSAEDERSILGLLEGRRAATDIGWIAPRLLAKQGNAVLWWLPGARRPMALRDAHVRTVTVAWPSLVLALNARQEFSLCAVKGAQRPTADTMAYHAPLGNIYANGTMCLGSNRPPETAGCEAMAAWERILLDSAFTSANHGQWVAKAGGRDAVAWWSHRAEHVAKTARFPDAVLVPMGLTLQDWWQP